MDTTEGTALRLIEDLAPDEVELAPAMIDAYLRGGKARQALFETAGSVPASFSSGDVILLTPYLIQAVAKAGQVLLAVLASPDLRDTMSTVKTTLELISAGHKAKDALARQPAAGQVKAAAEALSTEIHISGLDKNKCDELALKMLQSLLQNTDESRVMVRVFVDRPK